jgi:predicted nucleic acid-binding protein
MTTNIQSVETYDFSAGERLFLDTSAWLPIYAPQFSKRGRVAVYSGVFKTILSAGCEIHIDALVVSEFINRFAHFEFDRVKKAAGFQSFKAFRESGLFAPIAIAIADSCRRLLEHCTPIGSCFETVNAKTLLDDYATGKFDFNDQMYVEICKANDLKLVTHDRDFKDSGLFILTANQTLLSSV